MASMHPKPQEIKELQGTDRNDRKNPNRVEFGVLSSVPEPPYYLGQKGKELWATQLTQLANLKMLTEVDLVALGQYCREWELYLAAIDDINANGFVNKYQQVSAAVTLKDRAFKNMMMIADRFGFVASAREKLSMPDVGNEDPLDQHLGKLHLMKGANAETIQKFCVRTKLNKRIEKALIKAGIRTLSDLKDKFYSQNLKKVRGLGATSIKQIEAVL